MFVVGGVKNVSDRKEITRLLSKALEHYINPENDPRIYWSKEVTFGYGTLNQIRVDYMRFIPVNNTISGIEKGDFYCYEIKSSIEDFHSKNGHNFIGDYNYYIMLNSVYKKVKDEIPYKIGVMTLDDNEVMKIIKRAKRCDRECPVSEMLLMMFRSANRDRYKKESNEKVNNLTKCYDAYEIKIQEGDILYGMSNSSYCGIKGVVTYESSEKCFVLLNRDELYYLNPKMCRHFEIVGNKLNNPDVIDDLFEPLDY